MASVTISDFSGGKTDDYIDGPLNCCAEMKNVLIGRDQKPYSRAGFVGGITPLISGSGTTNITALYMFDSYLWVSAHVPSTSAKLYCKVGDTATAVDGYSTLADYYKGASPFYPHENNVSGNGTDVGRVSGFEWRGQYYCTSSACSRIRKVYPYSTWYTCLDVGLPPVNKTSINGSPSTGGSTYSYIYYFVWCHTYTVDGVTFEVFGPAYSSVTATSGAALGGANTMSIAGMPTLANSSPASSGESSYWTDSGQMKLNIYRTTNGGTVPYYLTAINNSTSSYTDSTSDATISANAILYIDGGALDYFEAPHAKYLALCNNVAWAGNCSVASYSANGVRGSETTYASRVYHSVPNIMDAWPTTNYVDMAEEVTGLAVLGSYPIVFTPTKVYRLEGNFDAFGNGAIVKRSISDTVGCYSNSSIVQLNGRLYFASIDGFYVTDGVRVQKISAHLNDSYVAAFATPVAALCCIVGAVDATSGRIFWAQTYSGSATTVIWVLDTTFGISDKSVFTTWETTYTKTIACPVGLNAIYRGSATGYLSSASLISTGTSQYDRYDYHFDNSGTVPSSVLTYSPITVEVSTCAMSFGSPTARKRTIRIDTTLRKFGTYHLTVGLETRRDLETSWTSLKDIRYRYNETTSRENTSWNAKGIIQAKRMIPHNKVRSNYRQVRYTLPRTEMYDSASLTDGYVTFNLFDMADVRSGENLYRLTLAGTNKWATSANGIIPDQTYIYLKRRSYAGATWLGPYLLSDIYPPVALCHCDRTSADFVDEFGGEIVASGGATQTATQYKFGPKSGDFTSSGNIRIHRRDLALGTGDFTIDFWARGNSAGMGSSGSKRTMMDFRSPGLLIGFKDGNKIFVSNDSWTIETGATIVASQWYHVAVTRSSGTARLFVDGTLIGSNADTTDYTNHLYYLGWKSYDCCSWIDEIEIIKGAAKWTTTFTPPTAAYLAAEVANTYQTTMIGIGTLSGGPSLSLLVDSATYDWVIYGYPYQQKMLLDNMSIHWIEGSNQAEGYQEAESGTDLT